jgi:hypothetical protein
MASQQKTEAEKIQDRLRARVADIRARKDLSEDGRQRQLAKAKTDADTEMRKVRAADEAARVQREEQLLRRLFGNASARDAASTVSYRDAMDRAEGLATPDEAFELLARARRSGDDLLARAVGMRALDQARTALPARGVAWSAVLDRWAQDEPPDIDRILIELGALHRASSSPSRLVASVAHTVPTPPELRGQNIPALARQADKDDSAA